jgi:hypothetical protein
MKTSHRARMALTAGVCLAGLALISAIPFRGQESVLSSADRTAPGKDPATAADAERLRTIARDLLARPTDAASVDRAAQLLQRASEIENQQAQAAKFLTEDQKLKQDLSQSRLLPLLASVTPLLTTVLLAGTLLLQSNQYKRQRLLDAEAAQRQVEAAQRQIDEAEDKRWTEAIKVLSDDHQLSPAGVLLATFSQSRRFGDRARDLALQLLTTSKSIEEFSSCLANLFEPVNWTNLKWILAADRSILVTYRRLDAKTFLDSKGSWDMSALTGEEHAAYYLAIDQIQALSAKVGTLLKSPRPDDQKPLDLNGTNFWRSDWKGADLSGADLTNCYLERVDLDGANLSAITRFEDATFDHCAWWKAAKVSAPFLDHLLQSRPFKDGESYGSGSKPVARPDYEASLGKLKQASSIA